MLGDPGVLDPGAEGEVGAPGVGAPPPGDPDGAPPPDVPPDPLPGAWATAGETRKKLTTASAIPCLHMVSSPEASVCSRGLCFCARNSKGSASTCATCQVAAPRGSTWRATRSVGLEGGAARVLVVARGSPRSSALVLPHPCTTRSSHPSGRVLLAVCVQLSHLDSPDHVPSCRGTDLARSQEPQALPGSDDEARGGEERAMAEDQVHCPKWGRMRLVMRRAGGQIATHRECEPCGFTTERPPARLGEGE